MLFVFLAGIAPKEYIHELLFAHTDSVHEVYKKGELVISGKHTHCSFLGFVFAPFVASGPQILVFAIADEFHGNNVSEYHAYFYSAHGVVSLRGPPVLS